MTEKEMVKEAVKSAEEELQNEEKNKIKAVVKVTLEILQKKKQSRRSLDDEIRILEKDISDLKDGRIDRIKERQEIDKKARDVSIIIIKEKIVEKHVPAQMWYYPWIIEVKPQYVPYMPTYYYTVGDNTVGAIAYGSGCQPTITTDTTDTTDANCTWTTFTTNNSVVHMHTGGTYQLEDGTIKYV